MKETAFLVISSLALAAVAVAQSGAPINERNTMLKSVVHVNYNDAKRQEKMLGNLENILEAEPSAVIEVVSHGAGMTLVQKSKAQHAEKIQALIGRGVRFVGCENTMRNENIAKSDLLADVATVPSGAVEVLQKQQEGYGYFRP